MDPPRTGSSVALAEFFFFYADPIIAGADPRMGAYLPMVLCMGFAHGFWHDGFGHDGFLPMVFCKSNQGNDSYVLFKG